MVSILKSLGKVRISIVDVLEIGLNVRSSILRSLGRVEVELVDDFGQSCKLLKRRKSLEVSNVISNEVSESFDRSSGLFQSVVGIVREIRVVLLSVSNLLSKLRIELGGFKSGEHVRGALVEVESVKELLSLLLQVLASLVTEFSLDSRFDVSLD